MQDDKVYINWILHSKEAEVVIKVEGVVICVYESEHRGQLLTAGQWSSAARFIQRQES